MDEQSATALQEANGKCSVNQVAVLASRQQSPRRNIYDLYETAISFTFTIGTTAVKVPNCPCMRKELTYRRVGTQPEGGAALNTLESRWPRSNKGLMI